MTVTQALQSARAQLRDSSDAPAIDAERLVLFVIGQKESSWLLTHDQALLTPEQEKLLLKLVKQRSTSYPLSYILGSWHFYGREFLVTPDVLIPRPDTENLVEIALKKIEELSKKLDRALTVADIGTGSACIAITLALESPFIEHIYATDISAKALEVAKQNAATYGVSKKITFLEGNMLEPLQGMSIDLIVSNPPYIPSGELDQPPTMERRGLGYEPKEALDGGPQGQTYINVIKTNGIPAILEVTGGEIQTFNFS